MSRLAVGKDASDSDSDDGKLTKQDSRNENRNTPNPETLVQKPHHDSSEKKNKDIGYWYFDIGASMKNRSWRIMEIGNTGGNVDNFTFWASLSLTVAVLRQRAVRRDAPRSLEEKEITPHIINPARSRLVCFLARLRLCLAYSVAFFCGFRPAAPALKASMRSRRSPVYRLHPICRFSSQQPLA